MVKKWPKTKRLVENSRNSDFFQDLSVLSFVETGPRPKVFALKPRKKIVAIGNGTAFYIILKYIGKSKNCRSYSILITIWGNYTN